MEKMFFVLRRIKRQMECGTISCKKGSVFWKDFKSESGKSDFRVLQYACSLSETGEFSEI